MTQKTQKPTGKLKDFIAAGKNPTIVLGAVDRHLLSKPADTSRRTDVLHPSEIIKPDWCQRASWFLLQGTVPTPRTLTTKQMRIFDQGHRTHAQWQEVFSDMGVLWGDWKCDACDVRIATETTRPRCPYCGSGDRVIYDEVRVASTAHQIEGHADGVIVGLTEQPLLLEIKSVGEGTFRWEDPSFWIQNDNDFKKAWANLKAPFYSHIMQAQIYMKLLEIMYEGTMTSYPTQALFLYESKIDQEVKEFLVPKSDFGIMDIFTQADEVVAAIKLGTAPACVDSSGSCSKCKDFNVN